MSESIEKDIHIQYFAILREQRGVSEESVATTVTTAAELFETLRAEYHFTLPIERLKLVVNESFTAWDYALADGDRLVFVPPVAGG